MKRTLLRHTGRRHWRVAVSLGAVFALVLAIGGTGPALAAGDIEDTHANPFADFDRRTGSVAPTAAQKQAAAALGARVTWNRFGTPESLVKDGAFLATVQGATAVEAARNFLAANKAIFLIDASKLTLHNDAHLTRSYGHAVTFRQQFGAFDAFPDGLVTVGLTGTPKAGWRVASVTSSLTGADTLTGSPQITMQEAWQRAAASVGHNVALPMIGSQHTVRSGFSVFNVGNMIESQLARPVALVTPHAVIPAFEVYVLGNAKNQNHNELVGYRTFVDARNGDVVMRSNTVHNLHQNNAPQVFTGSTGTVEGACGPEHTFAVANGTQSIDLGAFAEQPLNDIALRLLKPPSTTPLASSDDATPLRPGPELIHYAPPGGVPAGTYAAQVCDDPTAPPPQAPGNYRITVVINDVAPAAAGVPYPPKWRVFPANPLPHTLPADPWNNPDTDIRKLWCWVTSFNNQPIAGCDEEVRNLASRDPWDVTYVGAGPSKVSAITFSTNGNNAISSEAWTSPLTPGGLGQQGVSPTRNYDFPWTNAWFKSDCNQNELVPGGNDILAATTNLFAMHNRMHDWSYHLGFREDTWNAQMNNYNNQAPPPPGNPASTGDNDPVLGQSQAGAADGGWPDYLGRDNANMRTLPDGEPSITNMYLWQSLAGGFYAPCVDGDYDFGIIGHEYGHMIENRMIGKGANRSGHHAGAMGESNGDLNGMEVQHEHGVVPVADENPYAIGNYATGNKIRGIRNYGMNYAYAGAAPTPGVSPLVNPLNFSDMGYDFTGGQVHADGEIWSKVNFDIRQALVTKYNASFPASSKTLQKKCANGLNAPEFCPGNRRWIQIVYDAYLLMPTAPSMLVARDMYLAADQMRAADPDPADPNVSSHWPSNQRELWYQFALHGFGKGALSGNGGAVPADRNDVDPKPSFESQLHTPATLTFTASAPQQTAAGPPRARVYVGHFEARVSPIADTDPCTSAVVQTGPAQCYGAPPLLPAGSNLPPCNGANPHANCGGGENNLDNVARFVPGTYEFVAHAPGYGHLRFRRTLTAGASHIINLAFPTNWASKSQNAVATGDGARHDHLIDDTEGTNWERALCQFELLPDLIPACQLNPTFGDIRGSQVTVKLGSATAVPVTRVQVSAMTVPLDPVQPGQNRFSALRQFEISVCRTGASALNMTCNGSVPAGSNGLTPGFTRVLVSAGNAFPGAMPRPVAPDLILREFVLPAPSAPATHVQIRVLENQCTGNLAYQGDQDNDVTDPFGHDTDCRQGAPPYGSGAEVPVVGPVGLGRTPQRGTVRIAELQVFSTTGTAGPTQPTQPTPPLDPVATLTKTGPTTAAVGGTITYTLDYKNLGPNAASSAVLTDTLPAGVTFVSATGGGTYNTTTRKVTWNLGTLAAGATGTRSLTVRVASTVASGSVLINNAQLTAANTTATPAAWTTLVV